MSSRFDPDQRPLSLSLSRNIHARDSRHHPSKLQGSVSSGLSGEVRVFASARAQWDTGAGERTGEMGGRE